MKIKIEIYLLMLQYLFAAPWVSADTTPKNHCAHEQRTLSSFRDNYVHSRYMERLS